MKLLITLLLAFSLTHAIDATALITLLKKSPDGTYTKHLQNKDAKNTNENLVETIDVQKFSSLWTEIHVNGNKSRHLKDALIKSCPQR